MTRADEVDIRIFRHVAWACRLSGGGVNDMETALRATAQGIMSGRFDREEIRTIAEMCPILLRAYELTLGGSVEAVSALLIGYESVLRDEDLRRPVSFASFFDGLFDRCYLQKIKCFHPSAAEALPVERRFVRSTNSLALDDIPRYLVPWAMARSVR